MAMNRPTMRQLRDAKHRKQREEMQVAIAEGRLTVRQMTAEERKESDLNRAAKTELRAGRAASRAARPQPRGDVWLAPLATRARVASIGRRNVGGEPAPDEKR